MDLAYIKLLYFRLIYLSTIFFSATDNLFGKAVFKRGDLMLKKIGRLTPDDIKEIAQMLEEIYNLLVSETPEEGKKKLRKMASTPNYFIREELGRLMAKLKNQDLLLLLAESMLTDKLYGVRATALFYFYNYYINEPEKILAVVEKTIESVPWESESIINDLWKKHADVMKKQMLVWVKAKDEKKRAISFHGMENIANSDPAFIMEFMTNAIDDESMEVQKKITHILTQVARSRPAESYPYIREWLISADEKRMKTLWVSMKKLANIVIQKSKREKTQEFIMLTNQTINDWKRDENSNVSTMGKKLGSIIK